jgi:hypothetical protein
MMNQTVVEHESKIRVPSVVGEGLPYQATVYTPEGKIAIRKDKNGEDKEMVQGFDHLQSAERWCDRMLVDNGGPDWYGVIVGAGTKFQVKRDGSLGRVLASKGGPVTKGPAKSAGLGWTMKAKGDHFHFSKG